MKRTTTLFSALAGFMTLTMLGYLGSGLKSDITTQSAAASNIQYYGYYAGMMEGVGTGNYLTEIKSHSNLAFVSGDFSGKLSQVQANGMKAMVNPFWNLFELTPTTFRLRTDYVEQWQSLSQTLTPYRGSIAAFYLVDEPYMIGDQRGIPRSTVQQTIETAIALVKGTFPDIPHAVSFSFLESDDKLVIPQGYDWISMNCYGDFNNCQGKSIPQYYALLKSKMTPSQRLMAIPQAWWPGTIPPTQSDQDAIIARANLYRQFVTNEPLFVAIVPFLWQTFESGTGARDMASVKTYFTAWGTEVIPATPTPGSSKLPVVGVKASATHSGSSANYAVDGNTTTFWNAGGPPQQWIELDLGSTKSVTSLRLNVIQSPAGNTIHEIYAGTAAWPAMTKVHTFSQHTTEGTWINANFTSLSARYLRILTTASPSWVAWSEIEAYGTTPVPTASPSPLPTPTTTPSPSPTSTPTPTPTPSSSKLPVVAVKASATHSGSSVNYAVDGNTATFWNAGGPPQQWIELDLGSTKSVTSLRLNVIQSPAGNTIHEIYAGTSAWPAMTKVHTFSQHTIEGTWLNANFASLSARYLRILTTASPSWVAWSEIEAYGTTPVPTASPSPLPTPTTTPSPSPTSTPTPTPTSVPTPTPTPTPPQQCATLCTSDFHCCTGQRCVIPRGKFIGKCQ